MIPTPRKPMGTWLSGRMEPPMDTSLTLLPTYSSVRIGREDSLDTRARAMAYRRILLSTVMVQTPPHSGRASRDPALPDSMGHAGRVAQPFSNWRQQALWRSRLSVLCWHGACQPRGRGSRDWVVQGGAPPQAAKSRLVSKGWCSSKARGGDLEMGMCFPSCDDDENESVTNADFLCLGRKSTDDPGWPEPYPVRLFLGQLPSCSSRATALGEPAPNMPAGRGGAAVGTGKLQASSQGCLLASQWTKMRRGVPMSSHQPHSRVHTPSAVLALGDHRE